MQLCQGDEIDGCVAQLAEHPALNRKVGGSWPPAPTKQERKSMAHKYTILVASKAEGDHQTEDDLMQEIQDFAVGLREKHSRNAFVLVGTEFSVDPNEYSGSLALAKKEDVSP